MDNPNFHDELLKNHFPSGLLPQLGPRRLFENETGYSRSRKAEIITTGRH